jgi:hypothetical protein
MSSEIHPGARVLMPGSVMPGLYVVVEVTRAEHNTVIGTEVAPNSGTRDVQADRNLVVTLDSLPENKRSDGLAFSKGEMILQKVTGGYQLVEAVHDIPSGDGVASVRTYVSNGKFAEGVNMSTPTDVLVDPADMLKA